MEAEHNLVEMTEDEIYTEMVSGGNILSPIRLIAYTLSQFSGVVRETSLRVHEAEEKSVFVAALGEMGEALAEMELVMEISKKTLKAANRAADVFQNTEGLLKEE